ncbi:curli production assembly/transport component CsgF [Desulfobotulus alkaliphilus]|uniref:Curli production assembly/transport component CsgF n=1 Tax=Desulfobotulus alkaliphilus TaxID=622671 RepID=A0A562S761_9BACT|nr:curli assembly protein CsgF [Desulfobotulus alkaliphilus]TWI77227.1 curli production assembly/transport component CsgF [Desulfobotulus alkaliphilus]
MIKKRHFSIFSLLFLFAGSSLATELVYTPISPSFGGNPMNATFLLTMAEKQNDTKAPPTPRRDPLEDFEANLNRMVLNQLSRKIVNMAFGGYNDDLAGGTYHFGQYEIDITIMEGQSIGVSIIDSLTGGTTKVEVPYYGDMQNPGDW